ncbi:MAG: MMPL family transporter [Acidimicrobiales bacterium]
MTRRLYASLGRLVVRFRWPVVLAWIVVIVVSSRALPSLGSEVNNDNSQFLPSSAPSAKAATLATPILGSSSSTSEVFVVASSSNGTLVSADAAAVVHEAQLTAAVPKVKATHLLGTSPDGKVARILVLIGVNQVDVTDQKPVLDRLQATFGRLGAPPDLHFHLAGTVATNVANQASSNRTGSRVQLFSFLLIILLLILIFRSVLAPIVTLLPAGVALVVSNRFIGALGAHGIKISEITQLLLIVLLLGAGTDYGLFLVFRVREEIRSGLDPKGAVVKALARVGESISASAATVIFALLSLMLASFGIYHDLGLPLALGIAVMLVAGLTLLPALLAILGNAVFWPWRVVAVEGGEREGWWGRVAGRLVSRPIETLVLGVLVFGGLAGAVAGYHSGGFGGALQAPAGSDAAAGNTVLAKHFPEASSNPANLVLRYAAPVWSDPSPLEVAQQALQSSGKFTSLSGPLDPNGTALSPATLAELHARFGAPSSLPQDLPAGAQITSLEYNAYRATTQFVSADGTTVQFQAEFRAGPQESTAALDATPEIRKAVSVAANRSGAIASGVAGEAAALYDVSSTSNRDLLHVVPLAIIAIGILLALVLRSAVAPLYLIVSVALSYFAALGVSTLVFIDIGGSTGLTFILPFLMFIFLLALGEDYNILVMTRVREEAHGRALRDAVVRAIGRTGPTVTSAGIVLAGTFAVFGIAGGGGPSGSQIRDIGFGLAIGILMDTFLVRTLLVPSTVALLGRWNWWPARLGRRPGASREEETAMALASTSTSTGEPRTGSDAGQ